MARRTMPRIPAVVIGGGVIGCAVLLELTRRGVRAQLIESEPELGDGASKANSGIVHTGFDSHAGTLEALMLRRSRELWPHTIDELEVPYLPVGALMVARTREESARLRDEVAPHAGALGVEAELLARDEALAIAPYLSDDTLAALSIPGEAIVDPFWLTRSLAEAAVNGGADIRRSAAVVSLRVEDGSVEVGLDDGETLVADQVFDCAGIQADVIARLAGDGSFEIRPRKGVFLVSEESFGVDRIVLPIPGPMGKGCLVTPIVFGGVLMGPTATDQADRSDRSTTVEERERVMAACRELVPAMAHARPIRAFAGLRTASSTGDYVIGPSPVGDRLWLVAGIRSTGISASPAIAEFAVEGAMARRGWGNPARRTLRPSPVVEVEPEDIVCPCRSVSRGEVLAACRQPPGPLTFDDLKRRSGVGLGDCQGNICIPEAVSTLAAERGVEIRSVERGRRGSWIFADEAIRPVERQAPEPPTDGADVDSASVEVVIVGGGSAGSAAAEALCAHRRTIVLIERRTGRGDGAATEGASGLVGLTAIGIQPTDDGWVVSCQGRRGPADILARAVVLATGAYFEPAEHRGIDGPRPSGVVTWDFVEAAATHGLRVGERAVLVGGVDDVPPEVASRLPAIVETLERAPDEIRGERRLEGVRVGGRWIDCDTLILADRLVPQPFLLRALSLIDGRAGMAAPADDAGRLPIPGLWAAGCCVRPDVRHHGCAAHGRAVGAAVAASLGA